MGEVKFGAGVWGPFPLGRYVEYAVTAERLGFDAVWIGDTQLLTPNLYITGTLEAWSREVMPAWRLSLLAGR